MDSDKYIDGLTQIHFIGGMVRADMFVFGPNEGGEPSQESAGRLIMTPQGFISALNSMQQLADRLVEAGVLQKNRQQ